MAYVLHCRHPSANSKEELKYLDNKLFDYIVSDIYMKAAKITIMQDYKFKNICRKKHVIVYVILYVWHDKKNNIHGHSWVSAQKYDTDQRELKYIKISDVVLV